MDARILGKSGISTTVLGFGTAPLGDLYAANDEATAIATIEAALRGGLGLFDTSPLYGHGLAELRLGATLRRVPGAKPALSTKVGRVMEPRSPRGDGSGYAGGVDHGARFDYSYDGALRSLEQSMLRMGTGRIDVALIHDLNMRTHGDALDARFAEALNGAFKALARLRDEKVVKGVGVGVNDWEMCVRFARAADIDCVLLAGRYSLLEQPAAAEFLPLARARNIGVMLGGVFNSGILATGPVPGAMYNYRPAPPEILAKVAKIDAVCRAHGVALRDAAQRFPLAHQAVSCLVLGAVKPEEVAAQLASFAKPIPASLWADLKAQGLLDSDCPVPA
ncbi:MAG: aldo/keto reductase [Tagaea sp.]|nr:aldo/keto reductase [Tagaea sp.]